MCFVNHPPLGKQCLLVTCHCLAYGSFPAITLKNARRKAYCESTKHESWQSKKNSKSTCRARLNKSPKKCSWSITIAKISGFFNLQNSPTQFPVVCHLIHKYVKLRSRLVVKWCFKKTPSPRIMLIRCFDSMVDSFIFEVLKTNQKPQLAIYPRIDYEHDKHNTFGNVIECYLHICRIRVGCGFNIFSQSQFWKLLHHRSNNVSYIFEKFGTDQWRRLKKTRVA